MSSRPRYSLETPLDDIPLLDATTSGLLGPLVAGNEVFVVATARDGAVLPPAIDSMLRNAQGTRLNLEPLTRQGIETLLHRSLGAPVDGWTAKQLWEASSGNPLYTQELVMASIGSASTRDVDGVWRLEGTLGVTSALQTTITRRISTVGHEGLEVLEYLAVGGPVGLDDLGVWSDQLERLEREGLIVITGSQRRIEASITHPIHREVLLRGLSTIRARGIRRAQIDRVLSHGSCRRGDVLRVAMWSLDSIGTADPSVLRDAARAARQAHDFATVVRFVSGGFARRF